MKLGKKHVCQNCGTRFYDLEKSPATCPKCGSEHFPSVKKVQTSNKKTKTHEKKNTAKTDNRDTETVEIDDLEVLDGEDEVDLIDGEQEEDLMEDTSELGGDEHEMPEVKEHRDIGNMEK